MFLCDYTQTFLTVKVMAVGKVKSYGRRKSSYDLFFKTKSFRKGQIFNPLTVVCIFLANFAVKSDIIGSIVTTGC